MSSRSLPPDGMSWQDIRFSSVDGEVVGVDRMTDTHFETTAGSVVAFGTVVNVTAPAITAYSQASKRFWIRREDGTEMCVAAPDVVEARVGHKVTVLLASGKVKGEAKHQWCAIVNHSTRHWEQIDQFPPMRIHGAWTAFWGWLNSIPGNVGFTFGLFVLWGAFLFGYVYLTDKITMEVVFTTFGAAFAVVLGSVFAGLAQINGTKDDYARAVRRAVKATFESGSPESASARAAAE